MLEKIVQFAPLILPVICVPLFMRLIVAPIILYRLKNKYIKELTSTINEGWVDDRDLEAIEYLKTHAWRGLSTPFVISFNFNFLKNQLITLFTDITRIYNNQENSEINLKFSIQKILETLYLVFHDLYNDLKQLKLYRFLQKIPLDMFLRVNKLSESIKGITQNRIIVILQKYRITTKLLRLVLMPILGIPIIIYQLMFSLVYSIFFEGYIRFIYGLILIKVGYYTIYLYSDRNSSLHNRVKFNKKDIIKKGKIIEERHTQFKNRYNYSSNLSVALETLKNGIKKENIMHSRELNTEDNTWERLYTRAANTIKNTIEKELETDPKSKLDLKPLLPIAKNIGKIYFPNSEEPVYNLRLKEFLELGYFGTTLFLKNIYTVPASKQVLDKIPLKFIIDLNSFIEEREIKRYIPHIKQGSKVIRNVGNYYWASRILLKKSHPIIFVSNIVAPILFQHLTDGLKEYIYNRCGLLLIDSYESTTLKSKKCRINSLDD